VLADAPDLGVTGLGRRVGLSQPAAARMLDTLAAAGLARRTPGPGRTVPVRLTPATIALGVTAAAWRGCRWRGSRPGRRSRG
jgi:DNA-binding IclR family transcriptional regulator